MSARTPVLAAIRAYQRYVSPAFPRRCRFHPTCSEYAVSAVQEFGALRGVVLAMWRLLRCNPFSAGGVDYPRDQRLFRCSHGEDPSGMRPTA